MNPSDWQYIGEGGKHALFSYDGAETNTTNTAAAATATAAVSNNNKYSGRLLRIRKDLIVAAASSTGTDTFFEDDNDNDNDNDGDGLEIGKEEEEEDPIFYIRNFVSNSLFPYVDIPQHIQVDWSFLKQLHNQTLALGKIPHSRKKDWRMIHNDDGDQKEGPPTTTTTSHHRNRLKTTCMLINDLRRIHYYHHHPKCHHSTTINKNIPLPPPPSSSSSQKNSMEKTMMMIMNKTKEGNEEQLCHNCITIEIKPKAGYLPMSPLVDPLHRCKYKQSRFCLLQRLHQDGCLKKGWCDGDNAATTTTTTTTGGDDDESKIEKSEYDPLDFFSQESMRMKKAITALFKCPQNNLKVCFKEQFVFGHNVNEKESNNISFQILTCLQQALLLPGKEEQLLLSPTTTRSPPRLQLISILTEILIEIFVNESLLSKLLDAQKLDIVDADGAILIYKHLVDVYFDGDHMAAEASIDSAPTRRRILDNDFLPDEKIGLPTKTTATATVQQQKIEMLKNTPFDSSGVSDNLYKLCEEIAKFDSNNNKQHILVSSDDDKEQFLLNESRRIVIEMLRNLSEEDSIFLLVNWLFSLAMCDTSIFVTIQLPILQVSSDHQEEQQQHLSNAVGPTSSDVAEQQQFQASVDKRIDESSGAPGRLRLSFGNSISTLLYQVRMVDCDRKPARKLRDREERENLFRKVQ